MFGNKKIPPNDSICITFKSAIINRVTSIKIFGVFVDEQYNWKKQISYVSPKSLGVLEF